MASVLDRYRSPRVLLLITLGFASGLPLFLSGSTLSLWLTDSGFDIKTIGRFSLATLPYSLKFLWAPILDRYQLPFLGRRRGWTLLFQLGLIGGLVAMGIAGQEMNPYTMATLAALVAFFSASQDVVVDAYRTDLLPEKERGSGTASFVAGYRIALVVAGGFALVLADQIGWANVYFLMAGLMLIGVATTLLAPDPPPTRPPRTIGDAVIKPFVDFFQQRRSVVILIFVMLFKFGDYLASVLSGPFLREVGFSNTDIGMLQKSLGIVASIVGTVIGGGLVDRMGVRRALLTFGILQALTNVGYIALAIYGKSYALLVGAIAIDTFCGGLATVAFTAFLMALCNTRFSATQFALLTSAATVVGKLMGAYSGDIVEATSWAFFYSLTIIIAAPALLLLKLVPDPGPRSGEGPGSPEGPEQQEKAVKIA